MKTESTENHQIKIECSTMDMADFVKPPNMKREPDTDTTFNESAVFSEFHIKEEESFTNISSESEEVYSSNIKQFKQVDLNAEDEELNFNPENEEAHCNPEGEEVKFILEGEEANFNLKDQEDPFTSFNKNNTLNPTEINSGKKRKRSIKLSKAEERALKQQKLISGHPVHPPCRSCRLKCSERVNPQIRENMNKEFWNLIGLVNRRSFIIKHVKRVEIKRRTTIARTKRNNVFNYYVSDENGEKLKVCKTFFLTTLGFKANNDCALFNALRDVDNETLEPKMDMRGKIKNQDKKLSRNNAIQKHVESFHPCISHFRKEDLPSKRYLPNDLTIKDMHADFTQKYYAYRSTSYESYRTILTDMNISFAKVGIEECNICESFNKHDSTHDKKNLAPDCDICYKWSIHVKRASEAKEKYQSHVAEVSFNLDTAYFTADLQKGVLLPKMDPFQVVMFTRKLLVFNKSFVPLSPVDSNSKPMVLLWHEAIAGRKEEEIISVFYQFFLEYRDKKRVVLWLDDSFAQNKNWKFLTFLVYIVNSKDIDIESVEIFYFETGHACMSTDSFYHQVETSIKRKRKIYDFKDFENAVRQPNSKNFNVKVMTPWDFKHFKDQSSQQKLKTLISKPLMNDIKYLKAVRGSFTLKYRMNYDESVELAELDFIKKVKVMKNGFTKPEVVGTYRGIPEEKKQEIIEKLVEDMPASRRNFWYDLPVGSVVDLIDNNE